MKLRCIWILIMLLLLAACKGLEIRDTESAAEPIMKTSEVLEAQPAPTITETPSPTPLPIDQVWFAPNMGSKDYSELFTNPEQWVNARSEITVFKFYTQNVLDDPCTICGDNILSSFVAVDAFQKLTDWGIPISIEVGAVKEWGCRGTREAEVAVETIQNVTIHGGEVKILSMDEPLLGGQLNTGGISCGQTMEESARFTAHFIKLVHSQYPEIAIGDTEPYPHFSAAELEDWVAELEKNGVSLAFFHLDVDVERVRVYNHNVTEDLQRLNGFFEEKGIPFGVIFTSNWKAAGSNRAYYDSTMNWIRTVNNAIGKPQHIIFQSWQGPAASGAHEVPLNLPEDDPKAYSHVRLIIEGLGILSP